MTRPVLDATNPVPAGITFTQLAPCSICTAYARSRGDRIRREIRRTTPADQRLAKWWRFMAGVHDRHLAPARTASKETR